MSDSQGSPYIASQFHPNMLNASQFSQLTYITYLQTPVEVQSTPMLNIESQSMQDGSCIQWTSELEEVLLKAFIKVKKDSHNTGNGHFKSAGWTLTINTVKVKVPGHTVTCQKLDNCWRQVKQTWRKLVHHQSQIQDRAGIMRKIPL